MRTDPFVWLPVIGFRFLPLIPAEERLKYLVKLQMFSEAAELAFQLKNLEVSHGEHLFQPRLFLKNFIDCDDIFLFELGAMG